MVLFLHETAFITLAVEQADDGSTVLRLRQHIVLLQGQSTPDLDPRGDIIASCPLPDWQASDKLILGWDITDEGLGQAFAATSNSPNHCLAGLNHQLPIYHLSLEYAAGFVGTCTGIFAVGSGGILSCDWFEYQDG